MGEVLPDQPGRSDRKFTSDLAIGSIIGSARSWGPKQTALSGYSRVRSDHLSTSKQKSAA
jgi:hypothetical protein